MIQLINDRVLVRFDKPERLSLNRLLHLPSTAKRQNYELYQATVLAVGPGKLRKDGTRRPVECQVGDRVLCHWLVEESQDFPQFNGGHIIEEEYVQCRISHGE